MRHAFATRGFYPTPIYEATATPSGGDVPILSSRPLARSITQSPPNLSLSALLSSGPISRTLLLGKFLSINQCNRYMHISLSYKRRHPELEQIPEWSGDGGSQFATSIRSCAGRWGLGDAGTEYRHPRTGGSSELASSRAARCWRGSIGRVGTGTRRPDIIGSSKPIDRSIYRHFYSIKECGYCRCSSGWPVLAERQSGRGDIIRR